MTKTKKLKGQGPGMDFALPTTVGIVNHDPTRPRAPGYSMGGRLDEKVKSKAPGPQYKLEGGQTPRGTGYSPSYSITGRPRRSVWDSMMSGGPSPNAYNVPAPSMPWEKKAPMYSFGLPLRSGKKDTVPAPNSYQIPSALGPHIPHLKNGPASTLHAKGSDSRGFSFDSAKTPGPAGYGPVDLVHTNKRAPAVTMKSRTKLPAIQTTTPGPAAYGTTSLNHLSRNSPKLTLRVHYSDRIRPPLFSMTDVRH